MNLISSRESTYRNLRLFDTAISFASCLPHSLHTFRSQVQKGFWLRCGATRTARPLGSEMPEKGLLFGKVVMRPITELGPKAQSPVFPTEARDRSLEICSSMQSIPIIRFSLMPADEKKVAQLFILSQDWLLFCDVQPVEVCSWQGTRGLFNTSLDLPKRCRNTIFWELTGC
jgi:hypothetical protein